LWLVLGVCLLVACTARQPTLPASKALLPASDAIPGWRLEGGKVTYGREGLYGFMNGAADLYFTYGFEELAVGRYAGAGGEVLQVEVYRLASDADAYGVFTYNSYGEPTDLGVDGELVEAYRLAFWQDRTFVQILAQGQVSDEALGAFGEAISTALPGGGERPALVAALPAEGLLSRETRFFREKMALDNLFWLGPNDVLGLGPDSEGVLAHYEIYGQRLSLILVTFPDAARAQAAQAGLQVADVEDLVVAEIEGRTLGAVFGRLPAAAADAACDCDPYDSQRLFEQELEEMSSDLLGKALAGLT
jgi:hypothetical protein